MDGLPVVLVPSLLGSPRLYAEQLPALWKFGPVTIAAHRDDEDMAAIARRILAAAPPRFALVGLSMGGYVAFEIMRQAADRVDRLALLDTTARPDTPQQTSRRREQIALTKQGRFGEVADAFFPLWISPARHGDESLRRVVRQMADETGPEAFVRQQTAIMNRPDSRPDLAAIGCPTLALAGADDGLTTPEHAKEIADGVRQGQLAIVPECGHLSTLEQPESVTAALIEWLSL